MRRLGGRRTDPEVESFSVFGQCLVFRGVGINVQGSGGQSIGRKRKAVKQERTNDNTDTITTHTLWDGGGGLGFEGIGVAEP